jgi:hypothetical protein
MALIITLLLGICGGVAASLYFGLRASEQALSTRLNSHPPLRPVFLRDQQACEPRAAEQIKVDHAFLDLVSAASRAKQSWESPVFGHAVAYFAWEWRLASGNRYCPPSNEIVSELGLLMQAANWPRANTELNDLKLLERLPPSRRRANGLAEIAFLSHIPPSNLQGEDARPYARQLLAEQGVFGLPWAERALQEIGGTTRLGTSAAYLAVALTPVEALPQVERLMTETLRRSQARKTRAHKTGGKVFAIRSDDGNRLIELAYALGRGGAQAQPYSAPLIAILDEVIARPMPPFGLGAVAPTEFCRVARHIGGLVEEAANKKPFCAPDFRGGDGAPRNY